MISKDKYYRDVDGNAYLLGDVQRIDSRQVYAVIINDWTGLDSRVDVIGFNVAQFPFAYVGSLIEITQEDFTRLLIHNMRQLDNNMKTYPFKVTLERKIFCEYLLNEVSE